MVRGAQASFCFCGYLNFFHHGKKKHTYRYPSGGLSLLPYLWKPYTQPPGSFRSRLPSKTASHSTSLGLPIKGKTSDSCANSSAQEILTGGICLDVDDVALGPVGTAFIGEGDQGLHKDGVLCPRLETPHQPSRVVLRLGVIGPLRWVNVYHRPAVGATRILPVKLRHILIRTSKTEEGKTLPFCAYRSEHHRDTARGSYTPGR